MCLPESHKNFNKQSKRLFQRAYISLSETPYLILVHYNMYVSFNGPVPKEVDRCWKLFPVKMIKKEQITTTCGCLCGRALSSSPILRPASYSLSKRLTPDCGSQTLPRNPQAISAQGIFRKFYLSSFDFRVWCCLGLFWHRLAQIMCSVELLDDLYEGVG